MLLTWYTLRALAREWDATESSGGLVGGVIIDAYSVARGELTVVIETGPQVWALRTSVRPDLRYVFAQDGGGRPRKNATSLFPALMRQRIATVRVAERDRVLDLQTEQGLILRTVLFGPRANVLLADSEGQILEAFRERIAPSELPEPRPAPDPESAGDLRKRWPSGAQPLARAISRAVPLFDRLLAGEVVARAGLDVTDACLVEADHFERLAMTIRQMRAQLLDPSPGATAESTAGAAAAAESEAPAESATTAAAESATTAPAESAAESATTRRGPRVYRAGRAPVAFSLIPLSSVTGDLEVFDTTSEAVRAFVRAQLSESAFRAEYDPLMRGLEQAALRDRERSAAMQRELTGVSRADRYEHWGHLLMAHGSSIKAGLEQIELDDLFGEGTQTVPLDPSLTGIENAQRYYDKARRTRRSREEAESRVAEVTDRAGRLTHLVEVLSAVDDRKGLKAFRRDHRAGLAFLEGAGGGSGKDALPFRRYDLGLGYEVWVGRNARQNDELTFRHARKHDYWLHARGTSGSHVVLRRPGKQGKPPPAILEQAASIAAWHSKARGSGLVPVIVVERKWVRKPRKALPGAVLVDREEVLIVPPVLP